MLCAISGAQPPNPNTHAWTIGGPAGHVLSLVPPALSPRTVCGATSSPLGNLIVALWSQTPWIILIEFNVHKYSPTVTHHLCFSWAIFWRGGTYESNERKSRSHILPQSEPPLWKKWIVPHSKKKKKKMIFKITVSGISVYSSKKSDEALDSVLLSFRPAFYWVPITLQARGYTADPKVNELQSCKKQLLVEWEWEN